jgi:Ca2+:H+ antiporter
VTARAAPRPTGGFSRRDTTTFAITAAIALVALGLRAIDTSPVVVFIAAGIAVAALAYVLGEATEQAGESSSPRLAALLNATFGNAPELIIVILTVNAGLIGVAKASIIGSVLGNILLILGLSLLAGGIRHGNLTFAKRPAGVNSSMLTLAVVLVALPTLFAQLGHTTRSDERVVSYGAAGLMLLVYAAYLFHSLRQPGENESTGHGRWTKRTSLTVLAVAAVATGVLSEVLVKAIEPTIHDTGISETFVGLIIVPALGNIAEHLSAVRIAWRGNLDFAMGIVFNSGLQVALFITAAAVLAGTVLGNNLTIEFPPLELAVLGAAAIMAGFVTADGEATWIEGLELVAIYVLAALAFWFR